MLKRIIAGTAAALIASAALAGAQSKTLPGGELKTLSATVEAIEKSTRSVTVRKSDGTDVTFYVPKSMTRFDQLKVGDKINAKYYDTSVISVQDPTSANIDSAAAKLVPVEGAPAGTMSYQRTITATITALDPKVPSIEFTGPNNWKYSSRVNDKAALSKVKVGDKVTITWTAAVLMSIEGS